ncbi:MAG: hypothetical protein KF902_09660 [Phycisphaeraceae bacterium]|nr:hypothetical protein [Phycisphaeraceae bacterium]
MSPFRTTLITSMVPSILSFAAWAQPAERSQIQRVEAGVADVGPMRVSSRELPVDLLVPSGFEHVYRSTGDSQTLMRINGAIVAEFPRSQYNVSPWGPLPVVPAGTIFRIGPRLGGVWDVQPDADPQSVAFNRVNTRVGKVERPLLEDPDREVDRSIWQSDVYRAIRIRELLRRAAAEDSVHSTSQTDAS